MINVHYFSFGPFQENTYILWDDSKECIILDPGNSNTSENKKLSAFITENQLIPKRLILTHAHVDHINGNKYVFDTYGLLPEVHKEDVYFIEKHLATANMYGIPAEQSPMPKAFINEGDMVCVESPRGRVDIKARITDQVKPGVLSSTFHFPEVMLNNITSDEHDSEAMCPEYKVVAVNIRKSKGKYKELV